MYVATSANDSAVAPLQPLQPLKEAVVHKAIKPKTWGPHCWKLMDCVAFAYPLHPTADDRNTTASFFHSLCDVLPCLTCRQDFRKMLEADPIEFHLDGRESLVRWLHDKHNQVNEKLGADSLDLEAYVSQFSEAHEKKNEFGAQHLVAANVLSTGAKVYNPSGFTWLLWILLGASLLGGAFMLYKMRNKKGAKSDEI